MPGYTVIHKRRHGGKTVGSSGGGGGGGVLQATRTVQNDSGSTASGQKVSFGIGFPRGLIASGQKLEVRKSDGATAYARQQIDGLNTWDDGSLGFAVVTYEQEDNIAGSGTDTIKVYSAGTSAANNNSTLTISDIRALNYTVDWVAAGTTYTLDTQAAIDAGQYRITKVGPVMIEARIWGQFKNAGTAHATMFGLIWIGLMRNGTTAYAVPRLINNWSNNYSSRTCNDVDSTTSWVLKKAGSAVKTISMTQDVNGLEAGYIFNDDVTPIWNANAPTLRIVHEFLQQGTALLVPYMPLTAGIISVISGSPTAQNYLPFNRFDLPANLDDTGPKDSIGYISAWSIRHGAKQTTLTARKNRINAAAQAVIEKNIYSTTYGEVSVVRSQTYGSIVGNAALNLLGAGTSPITDSGNATPTISGNNVFHWPWAAYYSYCCEGDDWWLEDVLQDANHAIAQNADGNGQRIRIHTNGDTQTSIGRTDGGPRGFAWGFRNIDCAWRVCPDAHPLAAYIDDLRADHIAYCNSCCKAANQPNEAEALGMPLTSGANSGALLIDQVDNSGWCVRWFMVCYLTQVTAMVALRGGFTASDKWVTEAIEKWALGAGANCLYRSAAYTLNFATQNSNGHTNADLAQTWTDVGFGALTAPTWDSTTQFRQGGSCTAGIEGNYNGGGGYPPYWHGAAELWSQFGSISGDTVRAAMLTEEAAHPVTDANWDGSYLQFYFRKP